MYFRFNSNMLLLLIHLSSFQKYEGEGSWPWGGGNPMRAGVHNWRTTLYSLPPGSTAKLHLVCGV